MVEAYILATIQVGKVRGAFNQVKDLKGVKVVRIITGPYDLIILVEAEDMSTLTNVVVEEIHKVVGVISTNTAIIVE